MLRYWKAYIHLVVGLKAGWNLESENTLDAGGHKISKILRLLGQNFSVARIF